MMHRHLNHQDLTPAAIDDIIGRGKRRDWAALRTLCSLIPPCEKECCASVKRVLLIRMLSATISGNTMPNDIRPEWERVLASAAHLQRILPGAVLVGGTATTVYTQHRLSTDADHVLTDLRMRFDQVLAELESAAGCTRLGE